jgi:hypothetical protein
MNHDSTRSQYYYGLDWSRLLMVGPIAMVHMWNAWIGEPFVSSAPEGSLYPEFVRWISPVFGFSGIYVFVMSFFLYGLLGKTDLVRGKKNVARLAFLAMAMFSAQFNPQFPLPDPAYFYWEIFSFALLSLLLVSALGFLSDRVWFVLGGLAAVLLMIHPLWLHHRLDGVFAPIITQILVESETTFGPNGWFLLPWIGLPILAYAWGRFCRRDPNAPLHVKPLRIYGAFAFAMALSWIIPPGEAEYPFTLAADYYLYSFHQNPIYLWQRLLPFLLLLFVLSRPRINEALARTPLRFSRFIQWNKNFWFAYVLHFGIIDILANQRTFFDQYPLVFDWLWLIVILSVEALLQLFFHALKVYAWIFKQVFGGLRWPGVVKHE